MQGTYKQHEPYVTQLARQFLGPKNGFEIAPANSLKFLFRRSFNARSRASLRATFGRRSGEISWRSQMRIATFGRRSDVRPTSFLDVRKCDSQRLGEVRARSFDVRKCDLQCSGGARARFFDARRCDSQRSGALRARLFEVPRCDPQRSGAVRARFATARRCDS